MFAPDRLNPPRPLVLMKLTAEMVKVIMDLDYLILDGLKISLSFFVVGQESFATVLINWENVENTAHGRRWLAFFILFYFLQKHCR